MTEQNTGWQPKDLRKLACDAVKHLKEELDAIQARCDKLEVARNQVIQELIEKAKADFLDAQKRREEMSGTSLGLRVDRAKATYEWLKSQMEGE